MTNRETFDEISNAEGFKWPRNVTLQLISIIKKNYTRLQSGVKKNAYIEIANKINATHNLNLTYDKIESKWKGLKRTYKKISQGNSKRSQASSIWEFYDDVHEILQNDPDVTAELFLSTEDGSLHQTENNNNSVDDEEDFLTDFPKKRREDTQTELSNTEGFKWSKQATSKLISIMKKKHTRLESGVKKTVHTEIANELNATLNLNLTYDKIDSKWKGLKKSYHKVNEENKSGQTRMIWEFYDDMHEILGNRPEPSSPIPNKESEYDPLQSFQESESFVTDYRKRRRKNRDIDREAAIERRHAEKMEANKKFLELFKQMIDKM